MQNEVPRYLKSGSGLTAASLKRMAALAMLIDHIGVVLIGNSCCSGYEAGSAADNVYMITRMIGRLSLPCFVFLLVEGFLHTHDLRKYILRMGVFMLVSEIPFDLVFFGKLFEPSKQSIMVSLCLSLLMLSVIKTVRGRRESLPGKRKTEAVLIILTVAAFSAGAYFLQADYGFLCPALAASFYLFYGREPYRTITGCALLFADREVFSVTAYIPIYFYNGEKGKSSRYFFYIFYPAHLMALWLLKRYAM
jgi:hypothetical protein